MKNMKKISIIALALAVLVSFGCSKDYLDTYPTSSTSPGTIFESTDAAAVAVNGLNKLMRRQYGAYGQGYNGEGTVRLYVGDYLGANLMKGNSTSFLNSANGNLYVSNTSSLGGYSWYYYYMVIGNANTLIKNIDEAEGTDGDRAYIKAQALCYRAYCYFNLVQIFGRRWSDGSDKPSCVLRLTGDEPDNLDRATSGEVYAQIYADLDEAISLFNKSGKANSRRDGYTMDLDVAYAIYARVALTLYYYDYFAYAAYNAAASTVRNYPLLISRQLFDKIPTTDIRRAWWLDPAGYEGSFNTNTMKANAQNSKNKLWVYGQDYATQEGRAGILSNSCVFAYMNFKISNFAQPGIGHLCLFRSSEMLLVEAEAQYQLHNESAVRDLLMELNVTSKRDPAYTCDDKSGSALMDEIKFYRGVELWGEGFNWFDIKRWGDTISRKKYADGGNWMSQYAITITPNEKNNWTWCIPQSETNYNKGITSTAND